MPCPYDSQFPVSGRSSFCNEEFKQDANVNKGDIPILFGTEYAQWTYGKS